MKHSEMLNGLTCDADLLLDRCELIMRATDQFLANLQAAGEVN